LESFTPPFFPKNSSLAKKRSSSKRLFGSASPLGKLPRPSQTLPLGSMEVDSRVLRENARFHLRIFSPPFRAREKLPRAKSIGRLAPFPLLSRLPAFLLLPIPLAPPSRMLKSLPLRTEILGEFPLLSMDPSSDDQCPP